MTLHLHHLGGCAPEPLAHYLKALGILRVLDNQHHAHRFRGRWDGRSFVLITTASRDEIIEFFRESYAPSPVFNPWGARSGFYGGGSESGARRAMEAIASNISPRLIPFKEALAAVRKIVAEMGGAKPGEDDKREMLRRLRATVRGPGRLWLETCVADLGERFKAPAILGTGGNEGSGSYTSAYMSAVVECLVDRRWDHDIERCLFGQFPSTGSRWDGSFGQFIPDQAGSPWDLLLALEGALLVRSAVTRRHGAGGSPFASSPFYFAPVAAGYGSCGEFDEFVISKGRRQPGRGEQWFPLWHQPLAAGEIEQMFGEGRCTARRPRAGDATALDAARAISRWGCARGITAFARFGYQQRNNLATHFAVPLGQVLVRTHPRAKLLDDLSAWLDRLHRAARDKHAPARLKQAERRLADAAFAALTHDDQPGRWQVLLVSAAGVEAVQAGGTGIRVGPIPKLSPGWVVAADDGSVEFRLALALASAAAGYRREGRPIDPVRHHWLPLEPGARRYATREGRLALDPRVVCRGRDPEGDLLALGMRRLVEAGRGAERRVPVEAARGCGARLADLAALVAGEVDLGRSLQLARGLMALDWGAWRGRPRPASPLAVGAVPDDAWMCLRLALLPWPLDDARRIPADPAIVRRLAAGDAAGGVRLALRRLAAAGLRVTLAAGGADPATARRWGAALVFPIDRRTARRLARNLDPSIAKEPDHAR